MHDAEYLTITYFNKLGEYAQNMTHDIITQTRTRTDKELIKMRVYIYKK